MIHFTFGSIEEKFSKNRKLANIEYENILPVESGFHRTELQEIKYATGIKKFLKNRRLASYTQFVLVIIYVSRFAAAQDVYIKITAGRGWISQNRAILALDAEQ